MSQPKNSLGPRLARRDGAQLLIVDVQTRLLAAIPTDAAERIERNIGRLILGARTLSIPVAVSLQYPQGLGPLSPTLMAVLDGQREPDSADSTTRSESVEAGAATPKDASPPSTENIFVKTAFSCCADSALATRLGLAAQSDSEPNTRVGVSSDEAPRTLIDDTSTSQAEAQPVAPGASSNQANGTGDIVICGIEAHICVLQTALELRARLAPERRVIVVSDAVASRDPQHCEDALQRLRTELVIVANHESILFEWMRDSAHPAFKTVSALIR
ncbi:MAG: isochorismatase family protein [Thioalkalivibrionaceae bacterium]